MNTYLMFTICSRKKLKMFLDFYKEHNLNIGNISYARGTVAYDVLDYLGLQDDEKTLHTTIISEKTWKIVKKGLENDVHIDTPGTGINFIVPLSSVGGKKVFNYLLNGQEYTRGEETTMKDTKYELIVTIANYGYNADIIASAKKAGAFGGTILHGKGMGSKDAQQFLGVTLVSDKEIILIVTKSEAKETIMKAITSSNEEAGIVCFSMPVSDVTGFKLHSI